MGIRVMVAQLRYFRSPRKESFLLEELLLEELLLDGDANRNEEGEG